MASTVDSVVNWLSTLSGYLSEAVSSVDFLFLLLHLFRPSFSTGEVILGAKEVTCDIREVPRDVKVVKWYVGVGKLYAGVIKGCAGVAKWCAREVKISIKEFI